VKKNIVVLAVMLILLSVIAGCSGSTTPEASKTTAPGTTTVTNTTASTTAAATTQVNTTTTGTQTTSSVAATTSSPSPKKGGIFKYADPRAPSTTIGWFAETGAQSGLWSAPTFEGLMECDLMGNFYPCLATKWEIANDLSSITLTLRKGVKFHDGSDFNAAVAKWNIDMMVTNKVSSDWTNISTVDIIDEYTIKINVIKYQNTILNTLSSHNVISKEAYDKLGKEGLRWNPVGTGPFKFVSFQRDVVIKFARFDNYWRKDAQGNALPYLDGIEMYFVTDPVTMSAAFEAGDYDAFGGDLSSVQYDLQQKGYPIIKCFSGTYTLMPDSKNADSPWNKLKVRLALDYAINRDNLVNARGFGFWQTTYQYANPETANYIKNLTNRSYDLEKAKQLMAEAGYPNGFSTAIYADAASTDKDAITAIQAAMAKINIQADLQLLDFASYGNYRSKGWNNGVLAAVCGFMANLNSAFGMYWAKTAMFFPSIDKSDDLQNLYLASLRAKECDPALVQKVVQYMYDNALCLPLWVASRGDVIKPFVKDTGFYTLQSWVNWKPYMTWLDK